MRFSLLFFFKNTAPLRQLFAVLPLIFLLSAWPKTATAQQGFDYDIAESYFQVGQYEKAAALFKKLYEKKRDNFLCFERYRECLYRLGHFDELIPLLQNEIPVQPNNLSLRVQLAQVYYEMRQPQEGDAVMEKLCKEHNRLAVYKIAIEALEQVKAFPQMIKIIKLARTQFKKEDLFVREAASAYLFLSKYAAATIEYLKLLQGDMPEFGTVQSNIMSYAVKDRPEVLKQTLETIEREKENYSGISRQLLSQILTTLYLESGDYEGAFREADYLDRVTNACGHRLLNFANLAFAQKKYNEAVSAYESARARSTSGSVAQQAILGKAKARMALAKLSPDSASTQKLTDEAYSAYLQFVETYPSSPLMPRVLLKIAEVEKNELHQPLIAMQTLQKLTKKYSSLPEVYQAEYDKASILVLQNDLPQAAQILTALSENPDADPELKSDAKLLLGEVFFYQQNYEASLQTLNEISLGMKAGNNSLALKLLIFEGLADTLQHARALDALQAFSRVKKLIAQNKRTAAADSLSEWSARYSYSSLSDHALFEKGTLEADIAPARAVQTFEKIIADFPESFFADKSMFELGQLFEHTLNDNARAMSYYEKLIQNYPKSLYVKDARARLRALRQAALNG
ncbi:hypothetical protein Ctha_0933 [Chloroherpeton thalassium ATCC 35110]|uniref:Tetratricopeptide TPR_2 repeat protein n=1 Tax=Chloroherpeton thalassium (strain ATCC 35110 / GB-78) TaxID=517418 RepID=B3QXC4_CHLT3|nr:tetratricopeptide repeat protein [Chloroherpeton thalassium]ACF13398.1 hypothetical protein Ctha_0933 [Chloroherpeton thalassium ATCC 35110]